MSTDRPITPSAYTAKRKELLRAGVTIGHTDYGEFRVNFRNGREATAYYTTDPQDAIDTGWAMVREAQR